MSTKIKLYLSFFIFLISTCFSSFGSNSWLDEELEIMESADGDKPSAKRTRDDEVFSESPAHKKLKPNNEEGRVVDLPSDVMTLIFLFSIDDGKARKTITSLLLVDKRSFGLMTGYDIISCSEYEWIAQNSHSSNSVSQALVWSMREKLTTGKIKIIREYFIYGTEKKEKRPSYFATQNAFHSLEVSGEFNTARFAKKRDCFLM